MGIIKSSVRRLIMITLFMVALFTTFHSVSNVDAKQLSHWFFNSTQMRIPEPLQLTNNVRKQVGLSFKEMPTVEVAERLLSHKLVKADPPTLEEAIDWSQYPVEEVVATGYTAGYESTGKHPDHPSYGITYSGVEVRRDLYSTIAADPKTYPIGSILFIPGYGYGVVADTGSAIKGNKIDLYYETVDEVFEHWGKQEIDVYLVKEGEGKLTEEELMQLNEDETVQVFRNQMSF